MEKVYIVTDSTAGVPRNIVENKNVKVLPLTIEFEGKVYKDGVEIDEPTLLSMLDKGEKLPKTSQVNPNAFYEEYESIIKEGYKIISIHISSKVSGTYQSACIARDMIENNENIHVIDSKGVSFATGALVQETIKMLELGESVESTVEKINLLTDKVKVAFAVDNLEYIRKGGRISSIHAAVGTLLNIKPILCVEDGKIDVFDKVRGRKKALKRLLDYVKEQNPDTDITFAVGNVAAEDDVEEFKKMLKEENIIDDAQSVKVGSVIATYAGPGTIGVFFFKK
ncbi:DegV family protein [Clostridium cylindrosporum]|uniref:EDD domain protein, DegV family n=1 Tax=Clostridium cylindrosporum DSM 605 TaxID=1121307 RepID=A0A0J8D958_CLOCY|nr:DegV family protein [Clostridium cylindrosporum]KMT20813.1 EDD domain protein, DegV family [Clostridium cylindrosporum DSM 605]